MADVDAVLAALVGTWQGRGQGHYPTIADFGYVEDLQVDAVPRRPFVRWSQRTTDAASGEPRHAEVGFLRHVGEGRVELLLAHPFGIAEVAEGTLDGGVLDLRTTTLGIAATAKPVRALRRRYVVTDDVLTYDVWMSHGEHDDEHHLAARLVRAP